MLDEHTMSSSNKFIDRKYKGLYTKIAGMTVGRMLFTHALAYEDLNYMTVKSHQMNRCSILFTVIIIVILTSCSGNSPSTATHVPNVNPTPTLTPTAYVPVLQGTPIHHAKEALTVENADQMVQLARWGKGVARYVKYSPDGTYLAVSSTVGTYIYTGDTYLLLSSYEPVQGGTGDIAFFPDGKSIAVSTVEGVYILSIPMLIW